MVGWSSRDLKVLSMISGGVHSEHLVHIFKSIYNNRHLLIKPISMKLFYLPLHKKRTHKRLTMSSECIWMYQIANHKPNNQSAVEMSYCWRINQCTSKPKIHQIVLYNIYSLSNHQLKSMYLFHSIISIDILIVHDCILINCPFRGCGDC